MRDDKDYINQGSDNIEISNEETFKIFEYLRDGKTNTIMGFNIIGNAIIRVTYNQRDGYVFSEDGETIYHNHNILRAIETFKKRTQGQPIEWDEMNRRLLPPR